MDKMYSRISSGSSDPLQTVVNKVMSLWFGPLVQCFLTAEPWHQLYRAARDYPGIDNSFKRNFIFVNRPHHTHNCTNTLYDYAIINY